MKQSHFTSKSLNAGQIYEACQAYLDQYLGLSKKDITGSQFASLVNLISNAKVERIYAFDTKTIERLQHIFINDHADLYNFSTADLIKVVEGFENYGHYFNRTRLLKSVVDIVQEHQTYSDSDFLKLMVLFEKMDLFQDYEDLAVKTRV